MARVGALAGIGGLPPPVQAVIDDVDRVEWILETAHTAILLALRDARFPAEHGVEPFLDWVGKLNRETLAEHAASPREAIASIPELWSRLHRGTAVEVVRLGHRAALLFARHPPELFPSLALEWRRRALLAFVARAGAVQPTAQLVASAKGTFADLSWQ